MCLFDDTADATNGKVGTVIQVKAQYDFNSVERDADLKTPNDK